LLFFEVEVIQLQAQNVSLVKTDLLRFIGLQHFVVKMSQFTVMVYDSLCFGGFDVEVTGTEFILSEKQISLSNHHHELVKNFKVRRSEVNVTAVCVTVVRKSAVKSRA